MTIIDPATLDNPLGAVRVMAKGVQRCLQRDVFPVMASTAAVDAVSVNSLFRLLDGYQAHGFPTGDQRKKGELRDALKRAIAESFPDVSEEVAIQSIQGVLCAALRSYRAREVLTLLLLRRGGA